MADLGFSVGIEQSELAYLKTLQDALNNFKNATALVTKVVQQQNNETGELIETYTVQLNILEDIKGKMVAINKEYQATIKLNKDLMEGEIKKQRLTNKGITPAEIEKERKVNSMRRKRNEQAAQISEELKLHDPIFDILSNPNNQKLSNQMSLQISRLSKEFVNANISAEEFKTIVFDILKSGPKAFDKLPDQFENIGERALSIYNKIEDNRKNIEIQKESSTMIEWVKKKHKIIDAFNSASSIKQKENLDLLLTKMSAVYKLSGLTRDNFYKIFSQTFKDGIVNLDQLSEKEKQVAKYALEVRNKTDNMISSRNRKDESKDLVRSLLTTSSKYKIGMTDEEEKRFDRVVIKSRKFYENTNLTKDQFKAIFENVLVFGLRDFAKMTDEQRNAANYFLQLNDMLNKSTIRNNRSKESKDLAESLIRSSARYKTSMTAEEEKRFDRVIIKSRKFYENTTMTKDQFKAIFENVLLFGLRDFTKMTDEQRAAANYFLQLNDMLNKSGLRTQRSKESKDLAESLIRSSARYKTSITAEEEKRFDRVIIASRKFYENTTMTKDQFKAIFENVLLFGLRDFTKMTDEQRAAANHFLKLHDMLDKSAVKNNRSKDSKDLAESLIRSSARYKTGMTDEEEKRFDRVIIKSRKFYENTTMTKGQFKAIFENVLLFGLRDFTKMTDEQRAAANYFLQLNDMLNKSGLRTQRSRESKDLAQSLIRGSGVYKAGMTAEEEKRFDRVIIASRKFYENTTMTKDQFTTLFKDVIINGTRNFTRLTDEQRSAATHFLKLHDMLNKSGLRTQRSLVLNSRMLDLTSGLTSTRQISQIQALFKNIDSSIKNGKYSLVDFMREFSRLKGPESAVQILSKATNNLQIDIGRLKTAMEGKAGTGTGGGGGGPLSVLGELMTPKGLLGVFRLQLVHRLFSSLINSIANGAKQAAALDAKLIRIKTITQEINISDYEWKTRLLDISKQTGTESIETLDAAYKLFSNNIGKSVKSLKALQEALIFGKISNSTAQASVDLLSFTLNAFKINVSESERVLGVLFKTIDLGNITAEEMANTLGMTAPLAKQLGISLEEFNTAAVVITQQGVNFETSSTLIRNVIKEMINPTDAMKTLFQEWGVSSGEAAIKTYGLYGVLLKLRQEIDKGGTTRLGELIEDMRSLVAVPALAGKGNLELFKSTQLAMASASDTYTRAKDLVSESSSTIIDKVLNKISTSFIQIGSVIYDTMADLFRSDFGQGLVTVFEKLLKQIELISLAVEALILTTLEAFDNLPEDIKKQFNLDFGNKFFEVTEKGLKNYIKTVRDNMAEERKRSTIVLENLDNEIEKTKELIKEKERTIKMPNAAEMFLSPSPITGMENAVKAFAVTLQNLGLDFSEYFDANTGKEKQKLEDLLASKEAFGKVDELRLKISELEDKNLELAETTKNRTKGLVANIKMLFQEEGVEIDKILEKQKEKFKKISEDVTKKREELKNKFVEEEITKRLDVDGGIFAKLKIVGGVVFALKQQARDFFNIRNIDEARNKFDTIRNILTDINKDLRSGIKKSMEEITRIQIEMEDEAFKRTIEKKSKGTKDRMIKNRIQEIMAQAAQTIDIEESRRLFQKAAGLAGDLQADPKGQTIRQIREMQIQKEQQFIEFARNAMLDEAVLLQDRLNLEDNILAQETNINAQIERSLEIYKNIYAEQEKTLNLRKEELDVLRQQLQAILDAEGRKRTQVLPQEASAPAFATGGRLGIDNLIARVSPGEMIMSTAATNNWRPVLTAMNAGMFNNGGSTTTVGDINITMNQSGSAQTDVRELAGLLRRELRRGTIRLA